jgi:hypothetical protein
MKDNMSKDDKIAYAIHVKNQRIRLSVIEAAEYNAARKSSIKIASALLKADVSKELILTATAPYLNLEDMDMIERGEDPDRNTDDDE